MLTIGYYDPIIKLFPYPLVKKIKVVAITFLRFSRKNTIKEMEVVNI